LTLVLDRTENVQAFDATPTTPPASATFHGRDVFAPLAARLAMGEDAARLGRPLDAASLRRLDGLTPVRRGSRVTARVLAVDHFGNVVTSCDIAGYGRLPQAPALVSPVARPLSPVTAYAAIPPGGIGLLAGSQGYLELAAPCGSAAATLGLGPGDSLEFDLAEEV